MLVVIDAIKQEPFQGQLSHGWLTSLLWMNGFILKGEERARDQCLPVRPIR